MSEKIKPLHIIVLLCLSSIILTWANHIWIKNNLSHLPITWDPSNYAYMTLFEYKTLHNGGLLQFLRTVQTQAPALAPLFPVTGVPFLFLFGLDLNNIYLANGIYLFILLTSVFFIAERISGRTAAIVASFSVATFPGIIAFSRDYFFEFPSAAMTALVYMFLLKTDSFRNKRASVLFGIASALSLLTKTMGIVFLTVPFLYAFYIFARKRTPWTIRKHVLYAFLSFSLVAGIYYIPNFKAIFGYLFFYGVGKGAARYSAGLSNMLSIQYWTYYVSPIIHKGISPGYLLIFVLSATAFLISSGARKLSRDYWIVLLWLVCGYVLLSIPSNKVGERYALPILPPIAIMMAAHITRISMRPLKVLIIGLAFLIGIVNYAYQTFAEGCNYERYFLKSTRIALLEPVHVSCNMQRGLMIDSSKDWSLLPMLKYMDDNSQHYKSVNVLVAVDHNFLNNYGLRLYALWGELKGILKSEFTFDTAAFRPYSEDEIKQLLAKRQFIIVKTDYQGPGDTNEYNGVIKNLLKKEKPLKSFDMSDGSTVSIYSSIIGTR